jgi:hypothetical protein
MIATKLKFAAAASAIAVAGAMTTPPAQAAPIVPVPAAPITHIVEPALSPSTLQLGNLPLEIWWLSSSPSPNQSTATTVFSIKPLTLLPGFIQPLFGWFKDLNLNVCIAGVGLHVNAYGTVSATIARSC